MLSHTKTRNIKYKQMCRLQIFGDDNINTTTNFTYSLNNTAVINAIRLRFKLNSALADMRLSQNARCIVETCNVPSITNMTNKYVILRLVTSTQDKVCDTKKFLAGNPILMSMALSGTANANNILYNASEFFYNINVPPTFLQQSYIDVELECPSQTTTSIDFLTSSPLSTLFINLVIVDEDPELTTDTILAPPIDFKTWHVNMPIN